MWLFNGNLLQAINQMNYVLQTRPLPSIFESSCIQYSNVGGRKRKRSSTSQSKSAKLYTKDVVCLLPSENGKDIPIPRGNSRGCLANMGLNGKISLNSAWVAKDVTREITSIFASVFDLLPGELLPFDYLGQVFHVLLHLY